jgi:hypothetical protein
MSQNVLIQNMLRGPSNLGIKQAELVGPVFSSFLVARSYHCSAPGLPHTARPSLLQYIPEEEELHLE